MAVVRPTLDGPSRSPRLRAGRWPLTPLAPLVVSLVGAGAAVLIGLVASRELQRSSDATLEVHAKTVSAALAARLTSADPEDRGAVLTQAHARTGARFVLFDPERRSLAEGGKALPEPHDLADLSARASGLHEGAGHRSAFAVRSLGAPLEHLSLVTLVDAPSPAEGTVDMSRAVGVLTFLMLTVAAFVALALTAATREDLRLIRLRIAELAKPRSEASGLALRGSALPLRSFDQVGTLTAALNGLVARFAHEERCYRSDLEAAAQIDTERAQFLAGLSHELRTPLNAVLGFAHLLESEEPLGAEAREALAMIRASGEHLKLLIDDILDLSAAETGQLRLSRSVIDVRLVAEEVVREARATVGQRPVALVLEARGPALAWADPRRVRQILGNLISNALKATARGEVRIAIEAARAERVARIVVSDTGRGIESGALAAIFEPYRQAGDEVVRRGGAGLGLAITRQLVLLHGGTIEASSELGRGSVFEVRIPDDSKSSVSPKDSLAPHDSLVPWAEDATGSEPARDVLPSLTNEITERRRKLKGP
jgi:signal transduction histidine kinase